MWVRSDAEGEGQGTHTFTVDARKRANRKAISLGSKLGLLKDLPVAFRSMTDSKRLSAALHLSCGTHKWNCGDPRRSPSHFSIVTLIGRMLCLGWVRGRHSLGRDRHMWGWCRCVLGWGRSSSRKRAVVTKRMPAYRRIYTLLRCTKTAFAGTSREWINA